jgi:methylglyoxal reductase
MTSPLFNWHVGEDHWLFVMYPELRSKQDGPADLQTTLSKPADLPVYDDQAIQDLQGCKTLRWLLKIKAGARRMKKKRIGTTEIDTSQVGLGAWAIGGGPWWGDSDETEAIQAIHASLDAGITLIDTAPAYGLGRSESIVGRALKDRRNEAIIATKCGIWWEDARGVPVFEVEGVKAQRSLDPETIRHEIEMSLRRLQTDRIDLYQTHWPVTEPVGYRIADTMECLLKLKEEGKIRAIGACNVTVPQITDYLAVGRLDVVQLKYSMLDRAAETELLPFCVQSEITTIAYSPLEQGLLTGRIGMDHQLDQESSRNGIPWFKPGNRARVLALLESWKKLATDYQCTIGQLVIAWTIAQPGIDFALCGARNMRHAIENAKAVQLDLSEAVILQMREDVQNLGAPVE